MISAMTSLSSAGAAANALHDVIDIPIADPIPDIMFAFCLFMTLSHG
jgi:hypothetical protein